MILFHRLDVYAGEAGTMAEAVFVVHDITGVEKTLEELTLEGVTATKLVFLVAIDISELIAVQCDRPALSAFAFCNIA